MSLVHLTIVYFFGGVFGACLTLGLFYGHLQLLPIALIIAIVFIIRNWNELVKK